MEAGLIKVVQYLNRNLTHDSYFSIRRHTVLLMKGKRLGEMSGCFLWHHLPKHNAFQVVRALYSDPCLSEMSANKFVDSIADDYTA